MDEKEEEEEKKEEEGKEGTSDLEIKWPVTDNWKPFTRVNYYS